MKANILLNFLPRFLRTRLEGRDLLQRILGNIGWLIADRVMRMGVGLVVGVWIARYLGPSRFGLFNYAQAITALFSAIATLGIPNIMLRDLVKMPERHAQILASAFVLRMIGATIAVLLCIGTVVAMRPGDVAAWLLVIIVAASLWPQSMDVIEMRYRALTDVRSMVLLRNLAFITFSLLKAAALFLHASLSVFAWLFSLEFLLVAVLMYVYARWQGRSFKIGDAELAECRRQILESWPALIQLFAVGIYMRVDQVMIGRALGDHAVGLYSAAVRVSELWHFAPLAVMIAVNPVLIETHKRSQALYEEQLLRVMRVLTWISIAFCGLLSLSAPVIVSALYGPSYEPASAVLAIHAWGGVFVSLGTSAAYWFINVELVRYNLYQTISGVFVSVAANAVLIPQFGIVGSAIAMVITQVVSAFAVNAIFKATRPVFLLQLRSFRFS